MWDQDWWKEPDYDADEFDRFPKGAGYPGGKADWGWMQIILASLKPQGRAGIVKSAIGIERRLAKSIAFFEATSQAGKRLEG